MEIILRHQLRTKKNIPYSDRHLRREWQEGRFPMPRKINGKTLFWDEAEIDAWLESQPRADEKAA